MADPTAAARSCDECQAWYYDESGHRKTRGVHDIPRPQGELPACYKCAKCSGFKLADKTPANGRSSELSAKNWLTLWAYHEHTACGGTITDPMTRYNFGIIHWLTDRADRDISRASLMAN